MIDLFDRNGFRLGFADVNKSIVWRGPFRDGAKKDISSAANGDVCIAGGGGFCG